MMYGCLLGIQRNDQEMQGSVNSLRGQSSKANTEQPQLSFIFVLYFLLPVKHNLQIVMLHPTNGICRQCWEDGDMAPGSFESAVGWGERGDGGARGMYESRLGRPTGRVGELGEVGSPLAVEGLHTVI